MPIFLIIYHTSREGQQKISKLDFDEVIVMNDMMEAWKKSCKGHIVYLGHNLGKSKIAKSGNVFQEESDVSGYSVMIADDISEIEELLKTNPFLKLDSQSFIQIHEQNM